MMTEAVFAQASMLAGSLTDRDRELLRLLCQAAVASLTARLREGLTADSCREELVTGASLLALAEFRDAQGLENVEEFKAGDMTVKQTASSGFGPSDGLRRQAEGLMAPFLKDRFTFLEV